MKLIVGLGNPGRKYQGTRHNVGFDVAAELAKRHGRSEPRQKFQGEVVEAEFNSEKLLLLCPHTYMNSSGGAVLEARDFYKLQTEEVLVVCDDFQLPLAKLRLRASGSSGGQKGLADVIRRLGTDQVPRLRIGVGEVPTGHDVVNYVLTKFKKDERPEMDVAIAEAAEAALAWAKDGIATAMNRYN